MNNSDNNVSSGFVSTLVAISSIRNSGSKSSSGSTSSSSSSLGPPRSADSVFSVGIGDPLVSTTTTGTSIAKNATTELPCLIPEGATVVGEPLYNCIVFLIYCPEHDQIAVTNVDRCKCIWLPFVVLPDFTTWDQASHDGVAMLIGRNDAEMDAEEAERTRPLYHMTYLHMLRLQMPSKRHVLRLTRFVRLVKSEHFQCCQNTYRVHWLPFQMVLTNMITKLWGPELPILTSMVISPHPRIITEFTLANALHYFNLDESCEQQLLRESKVTPNLIYKIYIDYVEHCYPSFYMCFEAFRAYFIKYGWPRDDAKLAQLYITFRVNQRSFVDFHEFLVGLVVLEPTCSSHLEVRSYFIFK